MALVTQYNLMQNGPPEESKLATYMVCIILCQFNFLSLVFGSLSMTYVLLLLLLYRDKQI